MIIRGKLAQNVQLLNSSLGHIIFLPFLSAPEKHTPCTHMPWTHTFTHLMDVVLWIHHYFSARVQHCNQISQLLGNDLLSYGQLVN